MCKMFILVSESVAFPSESETWSEFISWLRKITKVKKNKITLCCEGRSTNAQRFGRKFKAEKIEAEEVIASSVSFGKTKNIHMDSDEMIYLAIRSAFEKIYHVKTSSLARVQRKHNSTKVEIKCF